jgi:hypothetical protein
MRGENEKKSNVPKQSGVEGTCATPSRPVMQRQNSQRASVYPKPENATQAMQCGDKARADGQCFEIAIERMQMRRTMMMRIVQEMTKVSEKRRRNDPCTKISSSDSPSPPSSSLRGSAFSSMSSRVVHVLCCLLILAFGAAETARRGRRDVHVHHVTSS